MLLAGCSVSEMPHFLVQSLIGQLSYICVTLNNTLKGSFWWRLDCFCDNLEYDNQSSKKQGKTIDKVSFAKRKFIITLKNYVVYQPVIAQFNTKCYAGVCSLLLRNLIAIPFLP